MHVLLYLSRSVWQRWSAKTNRQLNPIKTQNQKYFPTQSLFFLRNRKIQFHLLHPLSSAWTFLSAYCSHTLFYKSSIFSWVRKYMALSLCLIYPRFKSSEFYSPHILFLPSFLSLLYLLHFHSIWKSGFVNIEFWYTYCNSYWFLR